MGSPMDSIAQIRLKGIQMESCFSWNQFGEFVYFPHRTAVVVVLWQSLTLFYENLNDIHPNSFFFAS